MTAHLPCRNVSLMIEAHELSKRYRSTLAVDRLSFQVRPGQVTGFLGPNGAGKSSTMRMILGLDTPTSGIALVNGRPYQRLRHPLREAGALLDAGAALGSRRARDHLAWLAASNGLGRRRVAEVLTRTGLADAADKRIRGFSLGMRQRLGIAAALLGDPPVLIFDEPVNGLDPEGIAWIRGLMKTLAAEGRTIFVSSHLMSEMAQTAHHLLVIGGGRLIASTSMAEFIQASGLSDILVRSPQADQLTRLLSARGATVAPGSDGALAVTRFPPEAISQLAAAHGLAIHELAHRHPSLEQAYLKLTENAVEYHATTDRKQPSQ
jgi:ABC-2 type transport system ATP-binding protein